MADERAGRVDEPEELAAEDASARQETPPSASATARRRSPTSPSPSPSSAPPRRPRPLEPPRPPRAEAEELVVEGDEVPPTRTSRRADPRVKPEIPGMELEPTSSRGREALRQTRRATRTTSAAEEAEELLPQPIADAAIDLAAGARYRATGQAQDGRRARDLLPGNGTYTINGRSLEVYFPRRGPAAARSARRWRPSASRPRWTSWPRCTAAGCRPRPARLRHGISRALVDADPHLRGELKRRGFLTRDSRVKERKKAGLKKARKRPQFSKR
jgi:small subunit ribosomal protein S9